MPSNFLSHQECIGIALRTLRTERGLSQSEAATLHRISSSYLSLIEHGKRPAPLPLLFRMLDAYKVSPSSFVASLEDDAE